MTSDVRRQEGHPALTVSHEYLYGIGSDTTKCGTEQIYGSDHHWSVLIT